MGRNNEFHSAVLYHGTSADLKEGDYLDPSAVGNRPEKYVWSTHDINHAHAYAAGEYSSHPNGKAGHIYQVEPEEGDATTSPLNSPNSPGAKNVKELNKNVRSKNKVKVIKKIRTVLPVEDVSKNKRGTRGSS